MLRLSVTQKFDWLFEHSRRFLPNTNSSFNPGAYYYHTTCCSSSMLLLTQKNETSLIPSQFCKEENKLHISHVRSIESGLVSHHNHHLLKDSHLAYMLRLKQIYETLNAINALEVKKCSIPFDDIKLDEENNPENTKIYNISADDIITWVHDYCNNFLPVYNSQNLCQHDKQQEDLYSTTKSLAVNHYPLSYCAINLYHPTQLHSFVIPDSFYKHAMCSKKDVSEGSNPKKNGDDKGPTQQQLDSMQEYLIDHLPKLFSEKHDYGIYTKEVEFVINWYPGQSYSTIGKVQYALEVTKLRLFIHLRLANIKMVLLNVTNDIEDGSVKLRWRVSGIPHSKTLMFWKYFSKKNDENLTDDTEWLDGISIFYLNGDGLIKKHTINRIIQDEGKNTNEVPSMMEKLGLKLPLPVPT